MRTLLLTLLPALLLTAATTPKSDADIERDFRARLERSKVSASPVQIKVRNGTATLTGRTDVIQHKGAATRMARSAGARSVENRIEISAAAREKAAAGLQKARKNRETNLTAGKQKPPQPASTSASPPQARVPSADAPGPSSLAPPPVRRAVVKH